MAKSATNSKHKLTTYVPWILYGLAILLTIYLVGQGATFWRGYLRALVLFNVGIQGIWAAIGHLLYSEAAAKCIGWTSSPFQKEMGVCNLAIGITGILSFFMTNWLMPVALIAAILYVGCVWIHIRERVVRKNKASCNSGPMLYNTILVCASLFLCIIAY